MTSFAVRGIFHPGGEERQFTRHVEADNEDVARERVYAELGSEHGLARTRIDVEDVAPAEEAGSA